MYGNPIYRNYTDGWVSTGKNVICVKTVYYPYVGITWRSGFHLCSLNEEWGGGYYLY